MEAPIVNLTGGFTIIAILVTVFTIFLLTTRRLKIKMQKTLPYPKYYLSEAILYISGQEDKFPRRALFFMVENLREARLIKKQTALLAKLIIYLSYIFLIFPRYKRSIINRIFKWIRGELLIG